MKGERISADLFKQIAEEFRVSLTAAALRFAELYKGAMAVILSVNKRIGWMACNKYFTYRKLEKNEPVPVNTRVHDIFEQLMPNNYVMKQRIRKRGYKQFIKEKTDYLDTLDHTITVISADWFGDSDGYLNEIDFAMIKYNSVLTILYL